MENSKNEWAWVDPIPIAAYKHKDMMIDIFFPNKSEIYPVGISNKKIDKKYIACRVPTSDGVIPRLAKNKMNMHL
jgi:hypothetical protein